MNEALFDAAYSLARQHYQSATAAMFAGLDAQFPNEEHDTILNTSQRAMQLHLAAVNFARKVWAKELSSEKAEEMLTTQFSEFPTTTCHRAFEDAFIEAR